MTNIEFQAWPKIARLNRDITITEKIDGTNAAVIISDDLQVAAQSRKRLITPEADNFGFARWVNDNAETLASLLGPGRHYGEWWGSKIQRTYGLTNGDKRFSLFNTARYGDIDFAELPNMDTVPTLYQGPNEQKAVEECINKLKTFGSFAAPYFMKPEGVIVWHTAAQVMFKVTIEGDEKPKGANQ